MFFIGSSSQYNSQKLQAINHLTEEIAAQGIECSFECFLKSHPVSTTSRSFKQSITLEKRLPLALFLDGQLVLNSYVGTNVKCGENCHQLVHLCSGGKEGFTVSLCH